MSKLYKKTTHEKSIRTDIMLIKLKVTVALIFFKKIEIEEEERNVSYIIEKEIYKWCLLKGVRFSVRKVELPRYIKGHSVYRLNDMRHCRIMSFSK